MSAISNVTTSAGFSYATQLAQSSALERGLYNLGNAIQSGNLTSAGSVLKALMKANPQYASSSSDGAPSQDPVNQDFQAIANAISSNQTAAAQSAWTQLKSDLAKNGLTQITDGTADTAKLLAQNKASIDQTVLADLFGNSSQGSSPLALLGATTDPLSSLVSNWLTYKATGTSSAQPSTANSGTTLNSVA